MNEKLTEFYCTAIAFLKAERKDEKGATAVEYGLLVALIAAVIVGLVYTLGGQISAGFQSVIDGIGGTDAEDAKALGL